MNEGAFYQAAVPEPWTILGLRLRPFALGHLLLLHRLESVFAVGGEPTYDDLACAVFICSRRYEEAVEAFAGPDLDRFMWRWAERLQRPTWKHRLRLKRAEVIDLAAKCQQFQSYIQEGSETPYYSYDAKSRPLDCPIVQAVKVGLMSRMNFTEEEVLNRGWWLCLWDYLTLKAMEGQIEFQDKDMIQHAQTVADHLEQMLKEGKLRG